MLSRWPIRYKLAFGVSTLAFIVVTLSIVGLHGVNEYRRLARSISRRAHELPEAAQLTERVSELRNSLKHASRIREFPSELTESRSDFEREKFRQHMLDVKGSLSAYQKQLESPAPEEPRIGDRRQEWETVREIELVLGRIDQLIEDESWVLDGISLGRLDDNLDELHSLSNQLPIFLHERMRNFAHQVRGQYRTWIVFSWVSSLSAGALLIVLCFLFHHWIFRPLRVLIEGSRKVASGEFSHRIQLSSRDEVSELARAMNEMTSRFQEIRDDLDRQVKQRTKEVVRSEQLASVGFLAAGVAHEINNPLASVAWSAESLESRMQELLPLDTVECEERRKEIEIVQQYLRRIQEEAFRCKGITEKLLDFSRIGEVDRQSTNLHELTQGVIDMVRHLGKYRNKTIDCDCADSVVTVVNSQEIKQVVLNLLANALDSLGAEQGVVSVRLSRVGDTAKLVVADNGCGMSREVLEHLFEPFFTRRRGGEGTGLGLSITYRIVNDHGGRIEAQSDGPGKGSQFIVTLPLAKSGKSYEEERAA